MKPSILDHFPLLNELCNGAKQQQRVTITVKKTMCLVLAILDIFQKDSGSAGSCIIEEILAHTAGLGFMQFNATQMGQGAV